MSQKSPSALDAVARPLFDEAQRALPGIVVSYERFRDRVAALGESGDSAAQGRGQDLYIACACEGGDVAALQYFETALMPAIRGAMAKVTSRDDLIDDAAQELRLRLFCAPNPRIRSYSGQGPLWKWLRVTATRIVHDVIRARGTLPVEIDDVADLLLRDDLEPEFRLVRQRYGVMVRELLREAIAILSAEERTLLRLRYVQNQGIDRLAIPFRAHRATIARRLQNIREKIVAHLERRLGAKIPRLSSTEAQSLCRAIRSQVHFSFSRLVADDPDHPAV